MSDLLTHAQLRDMQKALAKELDTELYWGDDSRLELKKLPLGIASLDRALDGGLAYDRMTLLIGQESAGKTLLAMLAMKAGAAEGQSIVFIDVEKTWTAGWMRTVGLNPEDVLVSRPRTGEDVFNQAVAFIKAGVGILVLDSLAAITPSARLDQATDEMFNKQLVGANARLIGVGLGAMMAENRGTLVICINQLRENIGGYGNPETIPGGKQQKYTAWQIIRVRRAGWIEEGTGAKKKRIGYNLRVDVEKNKQGRPYQTAQVPFYFTGEFDELAAIIDIACDVGIIEVQTPNYFIPTVDQETGEIDKVKVYGRPRMIAMVRESQDIQDYLKRALDNIEAIDEELE